MIWGSDFENFAQHRGLLVMLQEDNVEFKIHPTLFSLLNKQTNQKTLHLQLSDLLWWQGAISSVLSSRYLKK